MARKKKKIQQETLPVKGEKPTPAPTTRRSRKSKGIPLNEVKKEKTLPVKGEKQKEVEYYKGTPIPVTLKSGEKGKVYWIRGSPRVLVKGKGFRPISEITKIRGKEISEGVIPMEELLERELLRTPKQRYMDESHTSSKVLQPNNPADIKWWLHPEKYDIKGIDTKGSNPLKEEEKLNPNFIKKYPFIEEVQERTLYPTSKGKRGHKGIPLNEVKKPTPAPTTRRSRKSKGIPLNEVKKEKTLPVKGEKPTPAPTTRRSRKSKGIPLNEVKKPTPAPTTRRSRKVEEFSLKELNKMADKINTKIDSNIVCHESSTGKGYICIDNTSKLVYSPKEIKTLYDTLFER